MGVACTRGGGYFRCPSLQCVHNCAKPYSLSHSPLHARVLLTLTQSASQSPQGGTGHLANQLVPSTHPSTFGNLSSGGRGLVLVWDNARPVAPHHMSRYCHKQQQCPAGPRVPPPQQPYPRCRFIRSSGIICVRPCNEGPSEKGLWTNTREGQKTHKSVKLQQCLHSILRITDTRNRSGL